MTFTPSARRGSSQYTGRSASKARRGTRVDDNPFEETVETVAWEASGFANWQDVKPWIEAGFTAVDACPWATFKVDAADAVVLNGAIGPGKGGLWITQGWSARQSARSGRAGLRTPQDGAGGWLAIASGDREQASKLAAFELHPTALARIATTGGGLDAEACRWADRFPEPRVRLEFSEVFASTEVAAGVYNMFGSLDPGPDAKRSQRLAEWHNLGFTPESAFMWDNDAKVAPVPAVVWQRMGFTTAAAREFTSLSIRPRDDLRRTLK